MMLVSPEKTAQYGEMLHPRAKKDPDTLLRSLILTAVVSMLVIVSLTGYGIYRVYEHYIIMNAEAEAISICEGLYQAEKGLLLSAGPNGKMHLAIEQTNLPLLDDHLRSFLRPFGIAKIKIYTPDHRIIYSTDTRIIGEVDSRNVRLKHALAGFSESELEDKDEVQDLADEQRFNVDVVETYIPVRDQYKNVIGCFEVYVDVTRYSQEIGSVVAWSVAIMGLVLLFVFGVSFILIRKGTNQLKKTQQVLEKLSITDSLTGILNQRHILVRAGAEYSKLLRSMEKDSANPFFLGFIMIDVDYFKTVNDTYGHLVGDSVLQAFADRIGNSLRDYDEVGRFGGEEFLVVLPNADLEQVGKAATRIWTAVRETPFTVDGAAIHVTASLGIACVTREDSDYTAALKRADDGLYKAKHSGRDRIASV
ncbi:MAG TPA: GGDEF domain-containing protein [Geobacteraceae bacterium]